jgi:Flp pilus assembly protein TadB
MADGRVTNVDIDRRVGHLEEVQNQHGDRLHELGNELQVVKLQVEHSQALMRAKFEQVIAATDSTSSKLDRLIERLDRESNAAVELDASPVGRVVKGQLESLEAGRKSNAARIEKLEGTVLRVAGALGLIGFLAPWLVPLIVGWLGLPK